MNEENVAIRLKGFIDSLGLTSSQFADKCGIPRPSLSQLLSGRNKKISDVLVGQIHSAFPELSVLWLLFGEGEMLVRDKSLESDNLVDESSETDNSSLPPVSENRKGNTTEVSNSHHQSSFPMNGRLEELLAEKESEIDQLRKEIEQLKRTPRKVAQITVYYDDSTFETFYPGSSVNRGLGR